MRLCRGYPYKLSASSLPAACQVRTEKQLQSIIHSDPSALDDTSSIRVVDAKKIALTNDGIVS